MPSCGKGQIIDGCGQVRGRVALLTADARRGREPQAEVLARRPDALRMRKLSSPLGFVVITKSLRFFECFQNICQLPFRQHAGRATELSRSTA